MTITIMEDTTTTATLGDRRRAARGSLGDAAPPLGGSIFEVPAGYRVIEDTDYSAGHPADFLITAIEPDGQLSDDQLERAAASLLGTVSIRVRTSSSEDRWFRSGSGIGSQSVQGTYVKGARIRQGITPALLTPEQTMLVCFADGTIARWNKEGEDSRPARRSLEVVRTPAGQTPPVLIGMDFGNREWVPVEAVTADTADTAGTDPFSTIPAGWKIAPTPPNQTGDTTRDMRIIKVHRSFPEFSRFEGTTRPGRYSSGDWFFLADGHGFYAEASQISPVPVPGRHYFLAAGQRVVVADDQRVLRELTSDGSIVTDVAIAPWIEVIRDEVETNLQPESFPFPVEASTSSPTLGLAASTTPELNPEPVAGGVYVAWSKGWTPGSMSTILHCVAAPDGSLWFAEAGRYRILPSGIRHRDLGNWSTELKTKESLEEGFDWILAAPRRVEFSSGPASAYLVTQILTLDRNKDLYSDALNELADEESWCPEFEQVVQPMGFPGRDRTRSYTVEVSVDFEWDNDDPSSRMDRNVESSLFYDNISNLSLTSMRMTGTVRTSILVEEVRVAGGDVEEAIREELSKDAVKDRLEDMMDGTIEVDDYTIESYEETEG